MAKANNAIETIAAFQKVVSDASVEADNLITKIGEAKQSAEDGRSDYDDCIDKGDKAGADVCLTEIAAARKKAKLLSERVGEFHPRVAGFREKIEGLHTLVRDMSAEYEKRVKAVEAFEREFESARSNVSRSVLLVRDLENKIKR